MNYLSKTSLIMKKTLFVCITFCAFIFLSGCLPTVKLSQELPETSPADALQAYFFGKFTKTSKIPLGYFSLNILNEETGEECVIPSTDEVERVYIFQIVPGNYRITRILVLTLFKEVLEEFKFSELEFTSSNKGLNGSFRVEPGTLVYLGDIRMSTHLSANKNAGILINPIKQTRTIDSIEDKFSATLNELLSKRNDLRSLKAKKLFGEADKRITDAEKSTDVKLGALIGTVGGFEGTDVVVNGKDTIGTQAPIGRVLIVAANGEYIYLQSTFPMQTVVKCKVTSGDLAKIKKGMKVYLKP